MLDAIVQLLRNGLCCIKDLQLWQQTVLWDPSYTLSFYSFPPPLDQTTPLEVLIGFAQLYAFFSTSLQGFTMVLNSYGKFQRIQKLMEPRSNKTTTPADRLVYASLVKEAMFAIRSMFIGTNVFFIGVSFFWLTANSFHVTETDWIGGLPGLIHALTIMEVCLVPLLYYMYKDGGEQLAKAQRMEELANRLSSSSAAVEPSDMGLASFEAMTGWLPFWDVGVNPLEPIDEKQDIQLLSKEVQKVDEMLNQLVVTKDKGEKEGKMQSQEIASSLQAKARTIRLEGYREYLYFVLNAIAFYGYLMGIVAYYWNDERKQPAWIQKGVLLGMNNTDADWHGNFAGDLMWTVEPVFILVTPSLFQRLQPRPTKLKAD